jgi:hypothetical protein
MTALQQAVLHLIATLVIVAAVTALICTGSINAQDGLGIIGTVAGVSLGVTGTKLGSTSTS